MIYRTSGGNLAIKCDMAGCERKFHPRVLLIQDTAIMRQRARRRGWSIYRASEDGPLLDQCADCRGKPQTTGSEPK